MAELLSARAQRVSGSAVTTTAIIMSAIVLLSDLTTAKPKCKPGWYYDPVTGNCDHCTDICEHAKAMETIEKCDRKCPGFRKADTKQKNECPPQHYYDDKVYRCHSCDTLCINAKITGSEQDCKNLCPDWSVGKEIEVSTKSSRNNATIHHGHVGQSPLLYVDVSNILAAVFALVVSLLVVFLLVAGILWYIRQRNKLNRKSCNKRPHQVVQQESHELESLTARGDPLSHPHDEG